MYLHSTWGLGSETAKMAQQKRGKWEIIQMFLLDVPLKHMKSKNLSNFLLKPANTINAIKLDSDPSPGTQAL
jgi:hypothetical protein